MKKTTKSVAKAAEHSPAKETPSAGPAEAEVMIGCDKFQPLQQIPEGFSLPAAVLAFEARYVTFALQSNAGSVTKAATALGLSHQNLSLQLTQRHKPLRAIKKPRAPRRDLSKL